MTWKLGMAVLDAATPAQVIEVLGLQPATAGGRSELPLGDAVDHGATHWGVGTLGKLTVVTGPVADEDAWCQLAGSGRALVFNLDEAGNSLYIYDAGQRVARREERRGARPWKPDHPLERRIRTKNKQDYIADVFRNMTGALLADSMNAVVEIRVRPAKSAAAKPELGELTASLERYLSEPAATGPGDTTLRGRWFDLMWVLDRGWIADRNEVVESWIPRVLEHVATWPDERRRLELAHFDVIAKGKDDGRFGEFAPLYRALVMKKPHGSIDWTPKLFANLFAHRACTALTTLDAGANDSFTPRFAELLAEAPNLANVKALRLNSIDLGNDGVARLVRAEHWTNLATLELGSTNIDAAVIPDLVASPLAAQLEAIVLDADDFAPVVRELALPRLRSLGLRWLKPEHVGPLVDLLESDALPDLAAVRLDGSSDAVAEAVRDIRRGLVVTTHHPHHGDD